MNVKKIDNAHNALRSIFENIGIVEDVTPDENGGYHFICEHITQE